MYYICISPSFKDRKRSKPHSFSIFILPLLRSKQPPRTSATPCARLLKMLWGAKSKRCEKVLWFSEKFAKFVKLWQPNMTEAVVLFQRSIPVGEFFFWVLSWYDDTRFFFKKCWNSSLIWWKPAGCARKAAPLKYHPSDPRFGHSGWCG